MANLSHANKYAFKGDIASWIKRRDYFGVSVGLTYKYYPVHRTVLSGLLSMLLRIYMIYFAASTCVKVWRGHTENIFSQITTFDLDDVSEKITPSELGFNLGFGFTKGLPSRYGEISVSVVFRDGKNGHKTDKKVNTYPCSQIKENWTNSTVWPFDNLTCSDAFNHAIYGSEFSTNGTQYIKLEVKACIGHEKCANETEIKEFFEDN